MRHLLLKSIISAAILSLPFAAYAADAKDAKDAKYDEVFQKSCVKAWMDRAGDTSDKVAFKNFGEKYCACAAGKQLDTDEQMDKAARTCMSQTMLQLTMDSLEEEPGLKNLTAENIEKGCQDEWKVINSKMSDAAKQRTDAFCKCASPKLFDLNKDRDNVTDQQWSDKINVIAESCSGAVQTNKSS